MKEAEEKIEKADQQKLQIFEGWKKVYSDALIKSLNPSGDILQIGFDEDSAERIQSFHPKTHTVIVSNPQAAAKASKWAGSHTNCSVIQGEWKSALPKLGSFKTIFYYDYKPSDATKTMNYLFSEEIMTEIAKTKELLKSIGDEMSQLPMRYSDNDLEEFYKKIGQYNQEKLATFFRNLANNKNISEQQYEKIVKKYKLDGDAPKSNETNLGPPEEMLSCLEECVKNHMLVGSRFTSFLNNITSKYEDAQFFEKIITNPHLEYKESLVPVSIQNKNYDALVMIIEKK